MIKHIKKKPINSIKVSEEIIEQLPESSALDLSNAIKTLKPRDVKDKNGFLIMDTGDVILSFFYNDNGNICAIPFANPILVYFHTARNTLVDIHIKRKDLLGLFRGDLKIDEKYLHLFYDFFGMTSSFVVLLMTALEAFVNQKIPIDYKYYKNEFDKFIKVYDSDQIQRWITLEEKIEQILNVISLKNFSKHYPNRYIFIKNLKELRDNIVHTKKGEGLETYSELFIKTLNFKFDNSIEAVRDFINYYEDSLIEPCNCGVDY